MSHLNIMIGICLGIVLIILMFDPAMESCLEIHTQAVCSNMLGR